MTYTIFSSKVEEVAKRLDRIARKAERYGVPFTYTIGETHPQKVAVKEIGPDCRTAETIHTYIVEAVDIEIECEGFVKANGWTVCAKIEHGDKGNIVTTFGTTTARPEWYTAPARCDHCGTNRFRAVTFICQHENGEFRQVGRSCLKDYTGIAPQVALMFAEVTDIFSDDMTSDWEGIRSGKVAQMYDVETILAFACDSIKAKGYIKSDCRNATKDQVIERVRDNRHGDPSKEGIEKAKAIIEWLNHLLDEEPDTIGVERDCVSLAKSGYAKIKHIGRLAYMPIAYDRYFERKEREAKRIAQAEAARNSSEYVGEIGKRMVFDIAEMKLLSSWETQFGTTHLYKFVTTDGNVLIWFASSTFGEWVTVNGHEMWKTYDTVSKIKATVKDHNERDGVKQTIINRCKLA